MKSAKAIIKNIPVSFQASREIPEVIIRGIQYDSRQVRKGDIFIALVGGNSDGHKYIPSAVENGAVLVVGTEPLADWMNIPVPYVQVENSREALAYISAVYYDNPARSLVIIGVTGTDGKTTTSNLIYQILRTAGLKAGIISTVNAQIGDEVLDTGFHVTTPEAPAVQYYLAKMRDAGITHVVLEATSHGLSQHRVTGCEFDIGVVTNITHEHLDYHGSYEKYRESKAKLFSMLLETSEKAVGNIRLAVLNKDDQSYPFLKNYVQAHQISYSLSEDADIWAEDITIHTGYIEFIACSSDFRFPVTIPISGEFNVFNALAAIAVCINGLGISTEHAIDGISKLPQIPGRMEVIDMGQNFTSIVDFAHTPNALQRALLTAREITSKRVIVIFGSAGLRDRQKRRMMAEVAAKYADITILTAEDPRTESLPLILDEMESAAREQGVINGETLFVVQDRGEAIRLGVSLANEGDLVMACGKGHEQSMCFGEIEYAWDDRTAMKAALAMEMGIEGPAMPYLPTQDK